MICDYCKGPLKPRRRGGRNQRFCRTACRRAFDTAARALGEQILTLPPGGRQGRRARPLQPRQRLLIRMPLLGRALREARLDREYSLKEAGRRIGVTPQYLSEIELGKRLVSRRTLDRVLSTYRLPVRSLLPLWLEERGRRDRILGWAQKELTFGEHCRRRRLELGLTQAELARRARLPLSSLALIETGRRPPWASRRARRRLLRALGLALRLDRVAQRERRGHRKGLFLPPPDVVEQEGRHGLGN